MAKNLGYARVSTDDQSTAPQLASLVAAGVAVADVHHETISGGVAAARRPVLADVLSQLERGDVLTVARVDRLGRDPADVLSVTRDLAARGVSVRFLDLGADSSTAAGQLVLGVLASVAGWERALIRERTRDGLAAARAAGRVGGRPRALSAVQVELARDLHQQGRSLRAIARVLRGRGDTLSASTVRAALAQPAR